MSQISQVLVTGGAGYVGSVLVPLLLARGYQVRVLDLFIYGDTLDPVSDNPNLKLVKGDLRDQTLLEKSLVGCDAVIHLACISNDPSFELNPSLSREINFDAFEPLVRISRDKGVQRFIYASTSSVYGVSDSLNVTEDHPLVPLTDYNKYKGLCEPILLKYQSDNFTTVIVRPATVCGYSPRQRLDLSVNILTNHAINQGRITVFGGEQMRPNIHIDDVCDLYCSLLEFPDALIAGEIFNAGYQNLKIRDIANTVREVVIKEQPDNDLDILTTPSDDKRSYHISSEKIGQVLGFKPIRGIQDAVKDLVIAFNGSKFEDPMNNPLYHNIKMMQDISFK